MDILEWTWLRSMKMITGASDIQEEAEGAGMVQPEEQKAQGDLTVCL